MQASKLYKNLTKIEKTEKDTNNPFFFKKNIREKKKFDSSPIRVVYFPSLGNTAKRANR